MARTPGTKNKTTRSRSGGGSNGGPQQRTMTMTQLGAKMLQLQDLNLPQIVQQVKNAKLTDLKNINWNDFEKAVNHCETVYYGLEHQHQQLQQFTAQQTATGQTGRGRGGRTASASTKTGRPRTRSANAQTGGRNQNTPLTQQFAQGQ